MSTSTVHAGDCEWPTVAVHSRGMSTRGARIKRERNRRRMSQIDLANSSGVGMRTIGRIEKGEAENSPSLETLEYHLGLVEGPPPASDEESPPRAIESFTLMELAAEMVRRIAQLEARTGERINGGEHLRMTWKTSDAPPTNRDHQRPGGEHGAK